MTTRTARRVDHVVHAVDDLDRTAGEYEALGFTVTPRADHPFGTSNRLVVLSGSYVEMVAVTRPDLVTGGFADHVRRFLDDGPGIAALALKSENASADHAALAATGLAIGEVMSFSRPAILADGSTGEASFSNVFTPGFPALSVFLCQQLTPDAVWDPGYMRHANGAASLTAIHGTWRPDVDGVRRLAAVSGGSVVETDTEIAFDLDGSRIVLARVGSDRAPGPLLSGLFIEGSTPARASVSGVGVTVGQP